MFAESSSFEFACYLPLVTNLEFVLEHQLKEFFMLQAIRFGVTPSYVRALMSESGVKEPLASIPQYRVYLVIEVWKRLPLE